MVSFDFKSLFTNVLLDRTINIILKRIYGNAELQTTITRLFNGKTYIKALSVTATVLPLGPVLADISIKSSKRH